MSYVVLGNLPEAGRLEEGFKRALSSGVSLPEEQAPAPLPPLFPLDPPRIIEPTQPDLHVKPENFDVLRLAARFPTVTTGALLALLWYLRR
jgi:hypothetical protein